MPEKLNLGFLKPQEGRASLSVIAGTVVMFIILLLTAQQALDTLGFTQLSALADNIVRYLPALFVGIVILLATLSLGQYSRDPGYRRPRKDIPLQAGLCRGQVRDHIPGHRHGA